MFGHGALYPGWGRITQTQSTAGFTGREARAAVSGGNTDTARQGNTAKAMAKKCLRGLGNVSLTGPVRHACRREPRSLRDRRVRAWRHGTISGSGWWIFEAMSLDNISGQATVCSGGWLRLVKSKKVHVKLYRPFGTNILDHDYLIEQIAYEFGVDVDVAFLPMSEEERLACSSELKTSDGDTLKMFGETARKIDRYFLVYEIMPDGRPRRCRDIEQKVASRRVN